MVSFPDLVIRVGSGFKEEFSEKRRELGLQPWNDTSKEHVYYDATYMLGRDFNVSVYHGFGRKNLALGLNKISPLLPVPHKGDIEVQQLASYNEGNFYVIRHREKLAKPVKPVYFIYVNSSLRIHAFLSEASDKFRQVIPQEIAILLSLLSYKNRYFANVDWHEVSRIFIHPEVGQFLSISFSKSVNKYLNDIGSPDHQCASYPVGMSENECFWRKVASSTFESMSKNCSGICTLPPYADIMALANVSNLCQTKPEATCMDKVFLQAYMHYYHQTPYGESTMDGCLKSCVQSKYTGSQKTLLDQELPPGSLAAIELDYIFGKMDVFDEVLLFDFSSFVGNVGGSLGLFIGFSYIQFAKSFAMAIIDFVYKRLD